MPCETAHGEFRSRVNVHSLGFGFQACFVEYTLFWRHFLDWKIGMYKEAWGVENRM